MNMTHTQSKQLENQNAVAAEESMCWSVHLMRRQPQRVPILVLTLCIAAGLVWELFHTPLPVFAAIGLLLFAASEYMFPIHYRLTETRIYCRCGLSRTAMEWKAIRRCQIARSTMRLSPLAAPSQLDAFRGITVRFAHDGEPGDRASVLAFAVQFAPQIRDSIERTQLPVDTALSEARATNLSHPLSGDVLNGRVSHE